MIIIPAIDIMDGKCVRLSRGDFGTMKVYSEDPLELALAFEAQGLKRLHLVDLDGARAKMIVNGKVLERIAKHSTLQIDFSGGISNTEALQQVFDAGAAFAAIGSMAVKEEAMVKNWIETYGPDRFIIAADSIDGRIAIHGWESTVDMGWEGLIGNYVACGIRQFFATDISRDGILAGPAVELYKNILARVPSISLIASGGVSSMEDLYQLKETGCAGAIVGKAIYEQRITLEQLKSFNGSC